MKNYLVTGIPRSGTSLFLNLIDNSSRLCFSEPPWLKTIRSASTNGKDLACHLKIKINDIRQEIKNQKPIEFVYKNNSSKVPDNYFIRHSNAIKKTREIKKVKFETKYSLVDFVIKANALFTANINELQTSNDWTIIPIVRDPLAVIMSWRSVNIASSQGRVKVVEKFSDELIEISNQIPLLKRQVLLLDWYFKQYSRYKKSEIVFYEDLIKDPNKQIEKYFHKKAKIKKRLVSKNNSKHYNLLEKEKILNAIKLYGHSLKDYYPHYN